MARNSSDSKTCVWRCVKNSTGNNVISVINIGKMDAKIQIEFRENFKEVICKDLINGPEVSSSPVLKPYQVYFVEVFPR